MPVVHSLQVGAEVRCVLATLQVHSADWWLATGPHNSRLHSEPQHRLLCTLSGRADVILVDQLSAPMVYMTEVVTTRLPDSRSEEHHV